MGDLLSVLAKAVQDPGVNVPGGCSQGDAQGKLPLLLLERVLGQPPPLLLSPIVWGCKSFGWQQGSSSTVHTSALAKLPRLPPPSPSPLQAPTPTSSPPTHGPTGDHHRGLVGPWMWPSCRGIPWVPHTQGSLSAPTPGWQELAKTEPLFLHPLASLQPGRVSTSWPWHVPPGAPQGARALS